MARQNRKRGSKQQPLADVCFLLEGTYPYIVGGVSTWIHHLIKNSPDINFGIVFISASRDIPQRIRYELPDNIVYFEEIYLHDIFIQKKKIWGNKGPVWKEINQFYDELCSQNVSGFEDIYDLIFNRKTKRLTAYELLFSKGVWNFIVSRYNKTATGLSFIDFFWTCRFLHLPLIKILEQQLPPASLYHAVCTGYAGLLGVLAKVQTGRPFILTEHGIYSYERKLEISKAKWIYTPEELSFSAQKGWGFFKDLWIKKFDLLARISYDYADEIFTLFEANKKMQIVGGADPQKVRIIPNGIDYDTFGSLKKKPRLSDEFVVGYVGRVVPIKDVKTFIKACKIVHEKEPRSKFLIIGATDEDPQYYKECKMLTQLIGLEDHVTFLGNVNMEKYYPSVDIIVLTSISEAQPLVLLEAMAAGIPAVAPDVGACRELLEGADDEDPPIGPFGILTPYSNPQLTATAILKILHDPSLREKMNKAGRERVNRFYGMKAMIDQYKAVYRKYAPVESDIM